MPDMRPPVLVTGGAGFIGSHVADAFLARGQRVVVLDDLSTGAAARVPAAARLEKADLRHADLAALLRGEKIGLVSHHAAQIDVRRSVEDPILDATINVLGTIRLAQACAAAGVAQLVFASSGGAIYGDPEGFSADESHPLNPCSPYGVAKLSGEKYLLALALGTRLTITILRYANVYGPRQDGRGEAGVVGIWMKKLLAGQEALINGDGGQTRDFVFVGDVVKANLAATDRRAAGVFNIGTGIETSVNELYDRVAEACGTLSPARRGPAKPGEQRRSVLNVDRARKALGLTSLTALREGLKETAAWFRKQGSRTP
jgi:UDP-glucose 4-epimerase